jgi:hypothetical protein
MKVDYLKAHLSRMWTRFNFFLTIELALFSLLGYLIFDTDGSHREANFIIFFAGMVTSSIWCFFGCQDRALVKIYREAIIDVACRLEQIEPKLRGYTKYAVGEKEPFSKPLLIFRKKNDKPCISDENRVHNRPYSTGGSTAKKVAYVEALSITRLPRVLGMVTFFLWLFMLYLYYKGFTPFQRII